MLSRRTLGVLAAVLVGLVLLSWATSRRYTPVEARGAGCPCGKDFDGCDEEMAVAEP